MNRIAIGNRVADVFKFAAKCAELVVDRLERGDHALRRCTICGENTWYGKSCRQMGFAAPPQDGGAER